MKTKINRFPALSLAAVVALVMLNAQFVTAHAQNKQKSDLSTPISAARTFYAAMKAGDTNLFRRITVGTDYQEDWMVAFIRSSLATDKLVKASETRFGHAETDKAFGEALRSTAMASVGLAALTNAEVKVDGTNAAITFKSTGESAPDPVKLRRAGGDWKVVLGDDINKADFNKDAMEAMAGSTEECAQAVGAGKYKTASEAAQAMMSGMMMKMQNQHPPK